jgi:predicted XRE-type DNA-binding protein
MQQITTLIETQNLTMVYDRPEVIEQAAQHFAEPIETITALQSGKIGEFSIEHLIAMLKRFRALAARGDRARGLALLDQLDARSESDGR